MAASPGSQGSEVHAQVPGRCLQGLRAGHTATSSGARPAITPSMGCILADQVGSLSQSSPARPAANAAAWTDRTGPVSAGFCCINCQFQINADWNAALNILGHPMRPVARGTGTPAWRGTLPLGTPTTRAQGYTGVCYPGVQVPQRCHRAMRNRPISCPVRAGTSRLGKWPHWARYTMRVCLRSR